MATQQEVLEMFAGPCPTTDAVMEKCTCPADTCPLRGRCCACVAFHRDHAGNPLPNCLRSKVPQAATV